MKYKRLYHKKTGIENIAIEVDNEWRILEDSSHTIIELLNYSPEQLLAHKTTKINTLSDYKKVIPFKPVAYRDFRKWV